MGTREQVLAEELLEAVGTLRRQVRGAVGRPWPEADLSGAEVDLVRLVRRHPHLGVGRAATELGLAPNSVSTLVRRLTDAGLLAREQDPDDRRAARLTLTPHAEATVEAWRDERAARVAQALGELTPAERHRVEEAMPALRRLTEALRETDRDEP